MPKEFENIDLNIRVDSHWYKIYPILTDMTLKSFIKTEQEEWKMSSTAYDTANSTPSEATNSVVVRTANVAQELLKIASAKKVSTHTLDFNLISMQTFSRIKNENISIDVDDWEELSPSELKGISQDQLLNPNFELKQMYEIEIFQITSPDPLEGFDASIAGNGTLCKIYLAVKAGSIIYYNEDFEHNIYDLITKKKLRASVLIGIFDSMLKQNLANLMAKIRVKGSYRFETAERYLVAEGIEPVPTVNDQLIFHYDKRSKGEQGKDAVDYANRSYISSVVENEVVIEYIKPSKGSNGRNCRGVFITSTDPIIKNEPTFTIGQNIERIETEKSIEFRAKAGGYVTFEGGSYDIKTEMDVSEISFRSTGSIDTRLDADVSINVKEKDALKDAVGAGMEVTVNVINIQGNVGPDAKITAHKATIEGQVHSSAVVQADELSINVHKGTAYGTDVHITRLEHGTVEADRVTITQATGGKVRAKEIIVEVLGSHTKLTASRLIEITKLQGGENVLTIDPLLNESRETLEDDTRKMKAVKTVMDEIAKELNGLKETMNDNLDTFNQIKKQLIHYKQNNVAVPAAYVQKYQQFQKLKEKITALQEEYNLKQDQYAYLSSHHIALQSEIFEARIINHDRWHTHNEIVFKLIEPAIDVFHIPHEGSEEKILGLDQEENGEFTIKVMTQ